MEDLSKLQEEVEEFIAKLTEEDPSCAQISAENSEMLETAKKIA